MLKEIGKSIFRWGVKNAPKILATVGVGGVVGTAVMAAKAAPKANERIAEIEWEPEDGNVEKVVKTVKAAAPVYLPAIGMGGVTIAAFLGSQHILNTRQAYKVTAAALAASVSETALKEWQDATLEQFGKTKYEKVMNTISKKQLPGIIEQNKNVPLPGEGDVLFADCQTRQMFWSTIENVRKAEAEISRRLTAEVMVTINDFYELLDIPYANLGDSNGWMIGRGDQFEIFFTYEPHPVTEQPITVINYDAVYLGRY